MLPVGQYQQRRQRESASANHNQAIQKQKPITIQRGLGTGHNPQLTWKTTQ